MMQGKRVLVCGARNKWSIAWHCALSILREGGEVAFSVYSDREKGDVEKLLAGEDKSAPIFLCNATVQEDIDRLFEQVGGVFAGKLDGLLHAIAFAKRDDLMGQFVTTSTDGWDTAMQSSAYTLVSLTRGARPLLQASGGGGVVALTYLGSERVVPGYNVMGVAKAALESSVRYLANDLGPENIRVNAVSAGPIKTLAASGIAGLSDMLKHVADKAPMRRGVDADEVGDAVAFLLSPLARGITGEILYVDAGYNIIGM
jgi:enoyl-[acyl-carrier protein] reductase I